MGCRETGFREYNPGERHMGMARDDGKSCREPRSAWPSWAPVARSHRTRILNMYTCKQPGHYLSCPHAPPQVGPGNAGNRAIGASQEAIQGMCWQCSRALHDCTGSDSGCDHVRACTCGCKIPGPRQCRKWLAKPSKHPVTIHLPVLGTGTLAIQEP